MSQKLIKNLNSQREQLTKEYEELMPQWMDSRTRENEFIGDPTLQARLVAIYSIIELIVRLINLLTQKSNKNEPSA